MHVTAFVLHQSGAGLFRLDHVTSPTTLLPNWLLARIITAMLQSASLAPFLLILVYLPETVSSSYAPMTPKFTAKHEQRLTRAVRNLPDATLEKLRRDCGAPVSRSVNLPASLKASSCIGRNAYTPANATRSRCRRNARAGIRRWRILVLKGWFLWTNWGHRPRSPPLYGRARAGERAEDTVPPDHHWQPLHWWTPCIWRGRAAPMEQPTPARRRRFPVLGGAVADAGAVAGLLRDLGQLEGAPMGDDLRKKKRRIMIQELKWK